MKASELEKPTSEVDCQKLWDKFMHAFSYKSPCGVTAVDYRPFFDMYTEQPIVDKVKLDEKNDNQGGE